MSLPDDEARSKALPYLEKALELGPELGETHFALAEFYWGRDNEKALGFADQAIAHNPSLAEAHWLRGRLLLLAQKFREGYAAQEKAYALNPLDSVTMEGMAAEAFAKGDPETALLRIGKLEKYRSALEINNDRGWVHLYYGQLAEYAADVRVARAENWPVNSVRVMDMHWLRARVTDGMMTLGLEDEALAWAEREHMDRVHMAHGKFAEALAYLDQADGTERQGPWWLQRGPNSRALSRVEVYLFSGNYQGIRDVLEPMGIRPGLPAPPHSAPRNLTLSIEVNYAFALTKTGDGEEGLRWARLTRDELADRFDQGLDMPHEHYEMARVLAMLGEDGEAVEKLDEAIEKGWRSWTFAFDPLIDSLRERSDFKQIEARYNADIERMREIALAEALAQEPD